MLPAGSSKPHDLPQQRGGLRTGEPQLLLAQLGQLAADAQPRQWQRRVAPARHHQPQLGRQPLQQQSQAVVDR
jgi:hypothetical protein